MRPVQFAELLGQHVVLEAIARNHLQSAILGRLWSAFQVRILAEFGGCCGRLGTAMQRTASEADKATEVISADGRGARLGEREAEKSSTSHGRFRTAPSDSGWPGWMV